MSARLFSGVKKAEQDSRRRRYGPDPGKRRATPSGQRANPVFRRLPTADCLRPSAYCLLPTASCPLLAAFHLPPTIYHLLPTALSRPLSCRISSSPSGCSVGQVLTRRSPRPRLKIDAPATGLRQGCQLPLVQRIGRCACQISIARLPPM